MSSVAGKSVAGNFFSIFFLKKMIFIAGDNIAGKSVAGNNNIRLNIKTNSVDANYKTNILLNIKHNSNANYKQTSDYN